VLWELSEVVLSEVADALVVVMSVCELVLSSLVLGELVLRSATSLLVLIPPLSFVLELDSDSPDSSARPQMRACNQGSRHVKRPIVRNRFQM